jgi:peptidoglycan/xylan/chitin deacetylase (PgdA/CDA1 family)
MSAELGRQEGTLESEKDTDAGPFDQAIPAILMYHSITPNEHDPYDITVRPERFDQQMRWLRRVGRKGTSVGQLLEAQRHGVARGLVGLSFDDGYADFVDYALPVLQRCGFSATVFVPAGRLGGNNDWDPGGPRKAVMTAGQLRQVAAAGIEVGSHGFRHMSLPSSSDGDLANEIGESRGILREVSGQEVPGFCYPYGHLDERAIHAVQGAGYSYGCAVWHSEFAGRYALPREYIRETDTPQRLWRRGVRRWLKQEYRGPGSRALRSTTGSGVPAAS